MKGDEIVQLYVHQQTSSVTRPVKELKNFSRIHLEPGETKTVSFPIDRNSLAFWDRNLHYTVEKSIFQIMTGPNSTTTQTVELTVK
jgi:beta-glucosidase